MLKCGMQSIQRYRSITPFAAALLVLLTLLVSAPPTRAADPKPDLGVIKKALEARYPGVHVLDVKPAAMPGLYEIYLGTEIVYSDATGDYLIGGPLVDTQTHQNLTEARLNDYGKVNFRSLPLERAIKVVKGNGSRTFAVFSDPDCPYCQQLEKSLLSVNNVTMYVFLFPIATLHPQAPSKAHAIWCAKDRSQAWSQWMHERKLPAGPNQVCADDPVDALQKLGDQLHVNSTPTLFFVNGKRATGAMSADELEKALNTASAK